MRWTKYYATMLVVTALFATTVLTSCSKKDNSDPVNGVNALQGAMARTPANSATINMHLMDAPGRFDAVYIDIKSIIIKTSDTTWDTLALFRPGIYNILNFKNDKDTLITTSLLVPGNISKMEMLVGKNNSVVVKGVSYPLTLSSSANNMIRIWTRFRGDDWGEGMGFGIAGHLGDRAMDDEDFDDGTLTIVAGGVYDIYADFDLAMSIRRMGDDDLFNWDKDHDGVPTQYVLRPVLRAFVKTNTGVLTGQVLPLAAMPTILASNGVDVFTAMPDDDGYFAFGMLPAGTYQVIIDPSIATYAADTMKGVTITANSITKLGLTTLH